MLTEPASKVSVPLTVVRRTAVSAAARAIELPATKPEPLLSYAVVDATQVLPVRFAIVIVPKTVLAPAPALDVMTDIPVVNEAFVAFANQPPPSYPDVV
jgi:hypothetical protein